LGFKKITNVLITGAAGNLGSLLSRHIRDHEKELDLIPIQHRNKISDDTKGFPRFQLRNADLSDQDTLYECLDDFRAGRN
jgi:nucleoside-diphosphate-sugar epimerase